MSKKKLAYAKKLAIAYIGANIVIAVVLLIMGVDIVKHFGV